MRRLIAAAAAGAVLLLATPSFAEPSADDRAVARSLFDEGRNLLKDGNFAAAIPKLEESQRLDPGVGTLFNLADCYEHVGRIASAWAAFAETADLAKRAGHEDRERLARDRALMLVPKLSKMHVHMTVPLPPGLELRYDGKPFSTAILDTDTPVDPGEHRIQATAPGKVTAETTLRIAPNSTTVAQVELPMLADAPVAPAPSAGPARPEGDTIGPAEARSTWQKPAAIAAGAGAVVGLAVGTIFGLKASSQWSDAEKTCPDNHCDAAGFAGWQDARSSATVGTIGFVAGAVLAATAIVLFVTAPSERSAPPATPTASARRSGTSSWRMP